MDDFNVEVENIKKRYELREKNNLGLDALRYNPLTSSVYMEAQEKERAIINWIRSCNISHISEKCLLEIGCGNGDDILRFIRLGFSPANIIANELLEDRAKIARLRLPSSISVICGNAAELPESIGLFDIIYQSMNFTSILNEKFRMKLAEKLWSITKAGGGILWYDFIYNNPQNHDVHGISIRELRTLFPNGQIKIWRLTLAPPINRAVTKIHPIFYTVFNILPILRTHVLCWIEKKEK